MNYLPYALAAGLTAAIALFPNIPILIAQNSPTSPPEQSETQRFKIRLTLSGSTDLKVREGDTVKEGEILADRLRDRQRLMNQRKQLELRIRRLQEPVISPAAARQIPEVAGLPPTSFLDEAARVEQSKVKIETAERAVMQQQRMLDLLDGIPDAEMPEATMPHEEEVLQQKQQELDQVNAELTLAQGQLAQAQAERQHQEYEHSLEISKRAIALQQSELQRQEQIQQSAREQKEREFQIAQLEAQIQAIDTQVFALASIRSPFSGTIRRIKYEEQTDNNLVIELQLIADIPSDGSKPKP
jgi:multidrug efflux pump subunit AcrA (membrane-fusion protein)